MTEVQRLETAMELLGKVLDMHERALDMATELRAVLFNHVHGLWIRSESIDERSIEECFP